MLSFDVLGDLDGPMIQRFIGFVGRDIANPNDQLDLHRVGGMTSGLATTLRIQSQCVLVW